MTTIKFSDISLDLHILDKFHQLTDQELVLDEHSFNVWNTFWSDFRYDYELGIYDLVELTLSHAYNYFMEEYRCEEDEDHAFAVQHARDIYNILVGRELC